MAKTDKRVDSYIARSADFAKPILIHLRKLVHEACPEVQETIKWGMPSFDYKGPFFSMASFKEHCVFGFWKYQLIKDPKGYLQKRANEGGEAMGNMGRITTLKDLPPDKILLDFIKQAKKLNDDGVKVPAKPKKEKQGIKPPDYFLEALSKNKKATNTFKNFSPSNKREYVEWITEAKTDVTRNKRMKTALEWMAEGKIRNWKYQKK